jgi:hypothetical protein
MNLRRLFQVLFWVNAITIEIYLLCQLVLELFFHRRL